MLTTELVEFLESGVSLLCGSRDANLRPECCRAVGATVARERTSLTLLLNAMTARRTIANLEHGGPIAMTASRISDYRTIQIKGMAKPARAATDAEHEIANRYLLAFTESLYQVGLQRAIVRRVRVTPTVAVELSIDQVFQQTPGLHAGSLL